MIAENISWGQFAGAAAATACAYYLYLLITGKIKLSSPVATTHGGNVSPVTQKEKKRFWQVKEEPADQQMEPEEISSGQHSAQEDNTFQMLEILATDVQEYISEAAETLPKEELLSVLSAMVKSYPQLNQPAFRAAISNIIIKAAKVDCLIDITTAETEALWGQP
jgi:hypothetical protein